METDHVTSDHDVKVCKVYSHMDIPVFVHHLLHKLGLSLRFVLTRGQIARTLVTAEQLALIVDTSD